MFANRKKYIIDKKFQLRTTFSLIAFVSFVFAVVVAFAGMNLIDVNKRISNMLEINKAISDTLSAPTPQTDPGDYEIYKLMQTKLDQNKSNLDEMIKFNTIVIYSVIGIVILQGIILFFILIRQTHRIAGPIYVMNLYMRQIIDGKIPETIRALRKGDYFKDTYAVFEEMVNTLRERARKN